jgi:hypothetical protein
VTGPVAGKRDPIRNRILWNRRPESTRDGGDIDEIVLSNVMVHVEQMSGRCWWIGVYKGDDPDAPYWMGNFTCDSRGHMSFSEQENAGIEWADDDAHKATI